MVQNQTHVFDVGTVHSSGGIPLVGCLQSPGGPNHCVHKLPLQGTIHFYFAIRIVGGEKRRYFAFFGRYPDRLRRKQK